MTLWNVIKYDYCKEFYDAWQKKNEAVVKMEN